MSESEPAPGFAAWEVRRSLGRRMSALPIPSGASAQASPHAALSQGRFVALRSWLGALLRSGQDRVPLVVEGRSLALGSATPSDAIVVERAQYGARRRELFHRLPGKPGYCWVRTRRRCRVANRGPLNAADSVQRSTQTWKPALGRAPAPRYSRLCV